MTDSSADKCSISDVINWAHSTSEAWNLLPQDGHSDSQQVPVHLWFRGHSTQGYHLIPSIFRFRDVEETFIQKGGYIEWSPREGSRKQPRVYEEGGLFAHLTRRIPDIFDTCPTTLDVLSLFRHYQLPSRLLDWTESVLVALWMTVSEKVETDGEIFALNARELARYIDFPHHQKQTELPVYGPDNLHVVLRTGMSLTYYLDELFSLGAVRDRALSQFSNEFWDCLVYLVSDLRSEDIEMIEELNEAKQVFENFRKLDGESQAYQKLYDTMPSLMKKQMYLYFGYCEDEKIIFKSKIDDEISIAKVWFCKFLFDLRKPVAIFPERRNARLVAQSGAFTLSGGDYLPQKVVRRGIGCRIPKPLHLNRESRDIVRYLTIPASSKSSLKKQLELIGIHSANMFPELEAQGKYLKDLWYVRLQD